MNLKSILSIPTVGILLFCTVFLIGCSGDAGSSNDSDSPGADSQSETGSASDSSDSNDSSDPQEPNSPNGEDNNEENASGESDPSAGGDEMSRNNGENQIPLVSGSRVIYSAAFVPNSNASRALYLAGTGSPDAPVRLNELTPDFLTEFELEDFSNFTFGPNGEKVFFIESAALQRPGQPSENGRGTLKSVGLDDPRIEERLTDSSSVISYKISNNGRKILFVAPTQLYPNPIALYLLDLNNPREAVRVSDDSIDNTNVISENYFFVDGGQGAVYLANDGQYADAGGGVYYVNFSSPAVAEGVNAPYNNLANLTDNFPLGLGDVKVSGDQTSVYYSTHIRHSIFTTDLNELGDSQLVSSDVSDPYYRLGPDGKVFFTNNSMFLMSFDPANGDATDYGLNCPDFVLSPDGSKIVCRSDRDTQDMFELFLVEAGNPSDVAKLNGPITAGGDVTERGFQFTPDSERVIYLADQEENNTQELFMARVSNPGTSTKVNGDLVFGGDVTRQGLNDGDHRSLQVGPAFDIDTAGQNVIYRADQDINNAFELYSVDLSTPGASVKLNQSLAEEDAGEERGVRKFHVDD